ncbi:TM221 protein, partial [Certhia familiaris]|nr:TM221 protein [Certhia familiaris]
RAGWFLQDSRCVRHAAIGLFCCGLCLYLTGKSLALFLPLLFELQAAIASACILTSGILILLLTALHALLRASQISQISQISRISPRSRWEHSRALYENDSARAPGSPRPQIQREFSFPLFPERKSQA